MSSDITRIFSLDSEIINFRDLEDNNWGNLSQLESPVPSSQSYYVSPLDRSRNAPKSVDHRIKESIKPIIENIEVLRPKKFNALLNETHSTLVKTIEEVDISEIKNSLHSLISLLEENTDLLNLFQNNTNWLQKA
jgi:hypothetical protein